MADPLQRVTLRPAAAASLAAGMVVAIGVCMGGPLRLPLGLPLVVAAFVVGCVAVARAGRGAEARTVSWPHLALSAMAATSLFVAADAPWPGWYDMVVRGVALVNVILIGVHAAGAGSGRRTMWCIVVPALLLPIAAPILVPSPRIDVWIWSQEVGRALLRGVHPYTVHMPDTYGGAYNYGYVTAVYPYAPLDTVLTAVGVGVARDYRFLLCAAQIATLLLARAAGRRLGAAARTIDVCTLALALFPRTPFLIVFGWKEPLVALLLAIALYAWSRSKSAAGAATATAAAVWWLVPTLKQYFLAPVLLHVLARPRPRVRVVLAGVGAAAVVVVPFLVWNWRATVDGQLEVTRAVLREDSFSVTAVLSMLFGVRAGWWPSVAAQLAVVVAARPRSLGGMLCASALALFASFLCASQAFLNYYYTVFVLFLFAALALEAGAEAEAEVEK
jgi:hypothetical protein